MSKLLRANFARLAKNKAFWGCMIFSFADALGMVTDMYDYRKSFGVVYTENTAFGQTFAAALISAVFVGLFVGTEHGNGTIRNKLIIGHSRAAVYSANLAVCAFASVMIHLVYFFTVLLGGVILSDNFITAPGNFWFRFVVSIVIAAAYAAMFLPVSMLVTSKANGVTAVILTALVLIIFSMVISTDFAQAEGIKGVIYRALYDILPTCQGLRIQVDDMPQNPAVLPLWSAGVAVAATAAGTVLFKRKDLK
ncbi:MAG: ABC transporter permease [Ruminococcus sp.]|nr:ABC transporter permease [Ruminococcus sp.]MCM1382676.1 ABC transporter permease [Muribaculaceae bacterium]MCM1480988.1 ABC transporter permease [Muribaculaceae bacterium]